MFYLLFLLNIILNPKNKELENKSSIKFSIIVLKLCETEKVKTSVYI